MAMARALHDGGFPATDGAVGSGEMVDTVKTVSFRFIGGICVAALTAWFAAGCQSAPGPAPAHWQEWRQERLESVAGTNGWSTLVGLHWLAEGVNAAGTDPAADIVFPAGRTPADAGRFVRRGKSVEFFARPGVPALLGDRPTIAAALHGDEHGEPSVLTIGGLRMFVVLRGERVGLRVKDSLARARRDFRGLDCFPYDPGRRVVARFDAYRPPRMHSLLDVTGTTSQEVCPGALRFRLDGQELSLDALIDPEVGDLFLLFRDASSGKTTYGSGRYLHAPLPDAAGNVVLDFNFAYNPPCAFTGFATCQLPPRQNWLPVEIRAGEKRYAGGH